MLRSLRVQVITVAAFVGTCMYNSAILAQNQTPDPSPQADPAQEARPWSKGITEADQARALAIFNEGNTYFETSQYALATEQYREALKSWGHPAIHFNMVVCLINLDQPKAAFGHLQEALKWGEAPLGKDVHARALTYQKLLKKQLTNVTIKSSQEGVKISLDGKPLFVAPGESTFVALPGAHQLVASKDGFLPHTEELNFVGGEKASKEVKLIPLGESQNYRLERRWAAWKPWTVFGAGAATAALGFGARFLASGDFDRYDNDIAILCPPQGCAENEISQATKDVLTRAEFEDRLGGALLITGAAATTTGLVLIYLNRVRRFEESLPTISPALNPDGASVSLSFPID